MQNAPQASTARSVLTVVTVLLMTLVTPGQANVLLVAWKVSLDYNAKVWYYSIKLLRMNRLDNKGNHLLQSFRSANKITYKALINNPHSFLTYMDSNLAIILTLIIKSEKKIAKKLTNFISGDCPGWLSCVVNDTHVCVCMQLPNLSGKLFSFLPWSRIWGQGVDRGRWCGGNVTPATSRRHHCCHCIQVG